VCEVDTDHVAEHMIERLALGDIGTALAQRDHQLHLVVEVAGRRRIRNRAAARDQG
jgi:hypothetical protein